MAPPHPGAAQELKTASNLLRTTINRYLDACSAFRDSYLRAIASKALSHEFVEAASDELLYLASFKNTLKRSKSAIALARNATPSTVPINSLPSELLIRIFQLVPDPMSYSLNTSTKPLAQDTLSHVCSRWRQVATCSSTLWSRVDLSLYSPAYDHLLARAETYITRAGLVPLDIRIYMGGLVAQAEVLDHSNLVQLSNSMAPQTRSLHLASHGMLTGLYRLLMQTFFTAGVPGVLSSLVLRAYEDGEDNHPRQFIESSENPSTTRSLLIDIPQERLEQLWVSVRILRVSGLCPYWTSRAYHGLVELRLSGGNLSINEPQLVDILVASPGLRVFVFDIPIISGSSQHNSLAPVHLQELEVLSFHSFRGEQETGFPIETFLRLLAPGSKPLSLSITGGSNDQSMHNDSVTQFLSRSRLTRLSLEGSGTYLLLAGLFPLVPHLKELTIEGFNLAENYPIAQSEKNTSHPPHLNLDKLAIVYCTINNLGTLRRILEENVAVRLLSAWECYSSDEDQYFSEELLRTELSDLCTVIPAAEPRDYYDLMREWE